MNTARWWTGCFMVANLSLVVAGCGSLVDTGAGVLFSSASSSGVGGGGGNEAPCPCGPGTTECSGACVDTKLDPANCGGCNMPCPGGQVCSGGACGLSCTGGTTLCGGVCVDTKLDPANCGGCNSPCPAGQVCSSGTCSTTIPLLLAVYSDTFTLGGVRTDGLYNDNSAGAYNLEKAPATIHWTPFSNFSFNTPQSSTDPALVGAALGDPGAATGLAQSGGGDFSFTYSDPSNNYVVQADAIIPGDRFDISSLPFAGATIFAGSSLSVFFRRIGSPLPRIGLYNGTKETDTGCSTGVTDENWHTFAVNFDQGTSHVRMFVDGYLTCVVDLVSFAGGAYKTYSKAAVGMGGNGGVTWMDNFQAGPAL